MKRVFEVSLPITNPHRPKSDSRALAVTFEADSDGHVAVEFYQQSRDSNPHQGPLVMSKSELMVLCRTLLAAMETGRL